MVYLLSEILVGLLVATLVGFWFGWTVRGVRERIRRKRLE